jgi:hypothetical protein
MNILYALVIIIIIISIVSTLFLTGKGDVDYSTKVKRNTKNLTLIYAVIIILSLFVLGIYISFFA